MGKEKRRSSMSADLAYMAMLILVFICVAFIVFSEDISYHIAALCLIFGIMVITHFTTVTLGLILNVVVIFAGFTWYLYQMISFGTPMRQDFYFWAAMGPVLTVMSHTIFKNMQQIENENRQLKNRIQHFSIIDDITELKNMQAYEMEFPIYYRIAIRYDIGLMLLVWQFRYADDLKRMLGESGMEQTAVALSKEMAESFRKEDVIYIISREPYLWGSLLLSKENSEELLKKRMKDSLEKMDFSEILGKHAPKLEIRVGVYYMNQQEETAFSMLEKARNSLQYDV